MFARSGHVLLSAELLILCLQGRSQQCTSQDKLCLFATWLEVQHNRHAS